MVIIKLLVVGCLLIVLAKDRKSIFMISNH